MDKEAVGMSDAVTREQIEAWAKRAGIVGSGADGALTEPNIVRLGDFAIAAREGLLSVGALAQQPSATERASGERRYLQIAREILLRGGKVAGLSDEEAAHLLARSDLAQQPAAQAAGLTECLNAHMSRFGPEPAGISAQRESDFVAGWNAAIARAASSGELRQKLHHFLNAAAGEGLQMDGVDADDLYIALFPAEYARAVASLDGDSAPQPSAQQAEPMIHYGGGLAGNVSFEQPAEEALGPFNTADEAIAALRVEEARGVDGGLMEAIRRYAFLFALHTQNNTDASRAEADAALARIRSLLAAPAAGAAQDEPFGWASASNGNYFTRTERIAKRIGGLIPVYTKPQAATGAQGLTWISVNDRLPPIGTGERVLIYTEGADFAGEQFFDIKADDLYPTPDGEQDARTEVAAAATHWMPLPYPGITPNQKDA
ncbi:DUF551 domain-containing protein [Cupriavidus gilardii]|uniref:DUF551 domain-containing protein n=1 Tax=Cupriavidus gilardii TaxID=82541 RepID=UPI001FD143EB|nr:DUF551 domain-containing protein [Cupriavidus gilardii]